MHDVKSVLECVYVFVCVCLYAHTVTCVCLCVVQDVGGQDKIRPLWRHYYTGTQGVYMDVCMNVCVYRRHSSMCLYHLIGCSTVVFRTLTVW